MKAANELDGAARQVLRQVVVQVHAEQEERDGVWVGDVDGLDVVVDADGAHGVDHLERVVQTLLGRRRLAVHVLQVRLDLSTRKQVRHVDTLNRCATYM